MGAGVGAAAEGVSNVVLKGVITTVGTYTTTVAAGYMNAIDFRTGEFDREAARKSLYSASTIAGALGAGVATFTGNLLGKGGILPEHTAERFSELGITKFASQFSGELVKYATYTVANWINDPDSDRKITDILFGGLNDMGGLTLNLLNVSSIAKLFGVEDSIADKMSMGLFELNFSNIGTSNFSINSRLGTGGIDVGGLLFDVFTNLTKNDLIQFGNDSKDFINKNIITEGKINNKIIDFINDSALVREARDRAEEIGYAINTESIPPDLIIVGSLSELPDLLGYRGLTFDNNILPGVVFGSANSNITLRMVGDGLTPLINNMFDTKISDLTNIITGGGISFDSAINDTLFLNLSFEYTLKGAEPGKKINFNVNTKISNELKLNFQYEVKFNNFSSGFKLNMNAEIFYSKSY